MPLNSRRLKPGESPFKANNPANAKSRGDLYSAGSKRKEQLSKLLNERASSTRRFPIGP